jgi:hypothetical protein
LLESIVLGVTLDCTRVTTGVDAIAAAEGDNKSLLFGDFRTRLDWHITSFINLFWIDWMVLLTGGSGEFEMQEDTNLGPNINGTNQTEHEVIRSSSL